MSVWWCWLCSYHDVNVTSNSHWKHRGIRPSSSTVDPIWCFMKSRHIIPFLDAQDELSLHFWSIPFISDLSSSHLLSAEDSCVQCHASAVYLRLHVSSINVMTPIAMCIRFVMDVGPVIISIVLIHYNVHVADPETGWVYCSGGQACREQEAQAEARLKLELSGGRTKNHFPHSTNNKCSKCTLSNLVSLDRVSSVEE